MKLSPEVLKSILVKPRRDSRGLNYYSECPWCGGDEFGISIHDENHPFRCFRGKKCGETGTIKKLLRKIDRVDLEEGLTIFNYNLSTLSNPLLDKQKIDFSLPTVTPPIGFKRIYSHEYLQERGLTLEDFEDFIFGETRIDPSFRNRFIVLIQDHTGEVKGHLSRSLLLKEEIEAINKKRKLQGLPKVLRYENSDTDFSKLLYGEHLIEETTDTLILVEGMFDVHSVSRGLGLRENPYMKCVGTYGKSVSTFHIEKFRFFGIRNLILAYDPDAIETSKEEAFHLDTMFKVKVVPLKEKDPGDMTPKEIEEAFQVQLSPFQFFTSKVNLFKL